MTDAEDHQEEWDGLLGITITPSFYNLVPRSSLAALLASKLESAATIPAHNFVWMPETFRVTDRVGGGVKAHGRIRAFHSDRAPGSYRYSPPNSRRSELISRALTELDAALRSAGIVATVEWGVYIASIAGDTSS